MKFKELFFSLLNVNIIFMSLILSKHLCIFHSSAPAFKTWWFFCGVFQWKFNVRLRIKIKKNWNQLWMEVNKRVCVCLLCLCNSSQRLRRNKWQKSWLRKQCVITRLLLTFAHFARLSVREIDFAFGEGCLKMSYAALTVFNLGQIKSVRVFQIIRSNWIRANISN